MAIRFACSRGVIDARLRPEKEISPVYGSFRLTQETSVDLPLPFLPTTAVIACGASEKSMRSSTNVFPYPAHT